MAELPAPTPVPSVLVQCDYPGARPAVEPNTFVLAYGNGNEPAGPTRRAYLPWLSAGPIRRGYPAGVLVAEGLAACMRACPAGRAAGGARGGAD